MWRSSKGRLYLGTSVRPATRETSFQLVLVSAISFCKSLTISRSRNEDWAVNWDICTVAQLPLKKTLKDMKAIVRMALLTNNAWKWRLLLSGSAFSWRGFLWASHINISFAAKWNSHKWILSNGDWKFWLFWNMQLSLCIRFSHTKTPTRESHVN